MFVFSSSLFESDENEVISFRLVFLIDLKVAVLVVLLRAEAVVIAELLLLPLRVNGLLNVKFSCFLFTLTGEDLLKMKFSLDAVLVVTLILSLFEFKSCCKSVSFDMNEKVSLSLVKLLLMLIVSFPVFQNRNDNESEGDIDLLFLVK